ncbi:unnamed protein product [Rhodiola kirilowii]
MPCSPLAIRFIHYLVSICMRESTHPLIGSMGDWL